MPVPQQVSPEYRIPALEQALAQAEADKAIKTAYINQLVQVIQEQDVQIAELTIPEQKASKTKS
jgi:NADH/NAD ratio-sensing transcriptional regulator Rex